MDVKKMLRGRDIPVADQNFDFKIPEVVKKKKCWTLCFKHFLDFTRVEQETIIFMHDQQYGMSGQYKKEIRKYYHLAKKLEAMSTGPDAVPK